MMFIVADAMFRLSFESSVNIGDLTASDAREIADTFESLDFDTLIETDTDENGMIVDSNNWKIVRIKKNKLQDFDRK